MPRCVILALDHSPLSSVSGPLEILLLGARLAAAHDWQIEVAAENTTQIRGQGGDLPECPYASGRCQSGRFTDRRRHR